MKCFVPFRTSSSPTRRYVVDMPATSEPAPGSVMQYAASEHSFTSWPRWATQLLRHCEVHQPELPRLPHHVVREGLLLVVLRRDRNDLVGGEAARGLLQLLLLGPDVAAFQHGMTPARARCSVRACAPCASTERDCTWRPTSPIRWPGRTRHWCASTWPASAAPTWRSAAAISASAAPRVTSGWGRWSLPQTLRCAGRVSSARSTSAAGPATGAAAASLATVPPVACRASSAPTGRSRS